MQFKESTSPKIAWRSMFWLPAAACALALTLTPAVSHSASLESDVPTLIDSDTLEYDDARQVSVFSGNVVLTRGNLSLRSERLELRQNEAGEQFAVATAGSGKQVFVRQTSEDHVEVVEGHADRAEYDSSSNVLEFIGHAVVSRLACGELIDQVRGERIRYNQETEVYRAEGGARSGGPNQRVRTVIGARQSSDETITQCDNSSGGGS